uniref:Uncharacterized protein n=1 Tax=Theileria annulata TaxID=5874 RepID=A0A3B0N2P9_THEAN
MNSVLIFFTLVATLVTCNRYYNDMVRLANFSYYNSFEDTIEYVRQLDLIADKYLQLIKKMDNDISLELRESSNYDLKSSSDTVNKTGANIINKMHARQMIVDLLMYQVHYAYRMYQTACAKYKGETVNRLFEDLNFSFPMNRMVIYEWVRQMELNVRKIMELEELENLSDGWKEVRESINTSPVQNSNQEPTDTATTPETTTTSTTGTATPTSTTGTTTPTVTPEPTIAEQVSKPAGT